jgi:hypothetical protein
MSKKAIVKGAVGTIVAISAGAVCKSLIKNNLPGPSGLWQKITLGVGAFFIAAYVSAKAEKEAEKMFDTVDQTIAQLRNQPVIETQETV